MATWVSIALSILSIAIILIQTQIASHITTKKLLKRDANLIELIILVFGYLLNNCQKSSNNLLLTIWAFISIVIISCFSGNILSSIVNQDMTSINSFEELVNSNLTIIGGKYAHFENFDKSWAGLETLKKLHNRTNFVHDYDVS
jgi:predicted signal transduction protein with EAL and GGDEF domain